jgi:hypothetical protein
MDKERKRPPAPELTEKDKTHLNWIRQNSTSLVRTALTLYKKSGRGTFIVREQDAKPSGTVAHYFPSIGISEVALGWINAQTAHLVSTYEPAHQFVIAFVYRDGAANVYTIRFVQTRETFAIEAV